MYFLASLAADSVSVIDMLLTLVTNWTEIGVIFDNRLCLKYTTPAGIGKVEVGAKAEVGKPKAEEFEKFPSAFRFLTSAFPC